MIDSFAVSLGMNAQDPGFWMPMVFMALLFAIIVAGTILDGFDIGVGCLALFAPADLRPRMLSLLSPWRDANEFWLFLGMGLFVAAFPHAWGSVMGELYLPLCVLALGVLLRSISFELRLRAPQELQSRWLLGFAVGSLITAAAHGLLLAQIVVTYQTRSGYLWFSLFLGFCAISAYCLLGASWLIMREAGELRARAVMWGRRAVRWAAAGAVGVSVVLAFANAGIFLKWSDGPHWPIVVLLWVCVLAGFVSIEMCFQRMINSSYRTTALPFVMTLMVFLITLGGLGYSFFPYLVLDDVTIWDAAASVDSLRLILATTVVALPVALIFNIWVYWRMFGLSIAPKPPVFKDRSAS
ncbi:cytochrome d ubiquinol oxidase subunit II [Candidimonas sp. SYP-B2681]|uniref:cytochrome d ubiquinol oxidase subunit II n=1 Tax=Candidimonas sp. SYP-B2681 TaxID=2497686 RepID=UPI000F882F48|nr:cytochrome d ubiquinol oxidase subunit II [Candidimonas sp. SYP-B2681]RTZ39182.1 cytochrome d ubiquinol oxidase subunit II [Candidimonas sp. SYP-B2681]